MSQPSSKIVKNTSKAGSDKFGYNYASLADIVNQGFTIPKMRIKPVFTPDGATYIGDYLEYQDDDGNWQLGSRVIDDKLASMNSQQSRGSSETYARRYTTLMALGIAGQDDKAVEQPTKNASAPAKDYSNSKLDFQQLRDEVAIIDDIESLQDIYKRLMADKPSPAQQKYINSIINKRKKELGQ